MTYPFDNITPVAAPPGPGARPNFASGIPGALSDAQRYQTLWGGSSPHQVLEQRQQGAPPPALTSEPMAPGGAQVGAPPMSPAAGSAMQNAAPGSLNGNVDNGSAGMSTQAIANLRQTMGAGQMPGAPMPGMGGPAMLGMAPDPNVDRRAEMQQAIQALGSQQEHAPMSGGPAPLMEYGGGMGSITPPPLELPQQPAGGGGGGMQILPMEQDATGAYKSATAADAGAGGVPETGQAGYAAGADGSGGFYGQAGNLQSWDSMTWKRFQNIIGGTKGTTAALFSNWVTHGTGWENKFWNGAGFKNPGKMPKLPDTETWQGEPVYLDESGAYTQEQMQAASQQSNGVARLMQEYNDLSAQINAGGVQYGNEQEDFSAERNKLNALSAALGGYGIGGEAPAPEIPPPPTGTIPVDPTDPTSPTVPTNPVDPTLPGPGPGAGGGGGGNDDDPGQILDPGGSPIPGSNDSPYQRNIPNTGLDWREAERAFPGYQDFGAANQIAAMELSNSFSERRADQLNHQLGVDELIRSLNAFQEDPLYGSIRDQAGALGEQKSLDWDRIQAQAVGDSQRAFQNLTASLGTTAGTNNLPSGSMAGLQGELSVGQADNLSRLIGELEVQKGENQRDWALQNLGVTQQAFGLTTGAVADMRQRLANALGGQLNASSNPAQGAFDASNALLSLSMADKAADEQRRQNSFNNTMGMVNAGIKGASLIPGLG